MSRRGTMSSNDGPNQAENAAMPSAPIQRPKPTPALHQIQKPKQENMVTIAVSSQVLFNIEEERQEEHNKDPYSKGPAFPFVKVLAEVNTRLRQLYPESDEVFDVVLMTNSHTCVGLRLLNTINHHQLNIERLCMTGGNSPIGYLEAYYTNLYLSTDPTKVKEALEADIPAATMFMPKKMTAVSETELCVAFDAVLFSDESDETDNADKPLGKGPLKCFLEALGKLQKKFYAKGQRKNCPIRTYLVTSRGAKSAGVLARKTLQSWGLETKELSSLAGAPKGRILEKIQPHIFFDDQMVHAESAVALGTVACHVPYDAWQCAPE